MSRILLLLSLCLIAVALPAQAPAQAQGTLNARLVTEFDIPNSLDDKFPHVATAGRTVHVAGNVNKLDAMHWSKGDTDGAFGQPFRVGDAIGQPDFSSATIATGPDGRAYYMWGNLQEGRLYFRLRETDGTWGPQRLIVARPFAIFPAIAVGANGVIYAAWVESGAPAFMRISTDNGATWSSSIRVAADVVFSVPITIAVSPSGLPAFAYTDEGLRVFVAFWNGTSFTREPVSPAGREMANAGLTYTPSGKLFAAYRGVSETGVSSGVHYIERIGANQWGPQTTLIAGKANGMINVVADSQNNLHFAWVGEPTGTGRVYYAFRSAVDGQLIGPIATNTGGMFNARLAVNIADEAYAHVVAERFGGSKPNIRYYRFAVTVPTPIKAVPVLEDGKDRVKRESTIKLGFNDISESPTQVRYRWGAAPTDAENDSGGWIAFQSAMTANVPGTDRIPNSCNAVTLYTQVRNAVATDQARSDSIILDGSVDAAVVAINPFMKRKAPTFTGNQLADQNSNGGASDGAPNYTRAPMFYLELLDQADCSTIKDVATGQSQTSIAPPYVVTNKFYANVVPMPGLPVPGSNAILVRVSDGVNNTSDTTYTFIYDVEAPVLTNAASAGLTVTSSPNATLITRLDIANATVTDNAYPGRGFWGVWVANSRTPVADPANDPSLFWLPLEAPGTGNSFSITGWSLASGLRPDQITSGTYHVYVRFLDGAGNPTSGFLTASVNLTGAPTAPQIYIPLMQR